MCSATGAIAVGSRCAHLAGGVAAVATQYHTDWRLGPAAINLVRRGLEPEEVLATLRRDDEFFADRQVGIVDAQGHAAVHAGDGGYAVAGEGYALLGNGIVSPDVIDVMQSAWEARDAGIAFEDQLLRTIEAGMHAGGDAGGHLSAALFSAPPGRSHPRVQLRVDRSHTAPRDGGNAVVELRSIFDDYQPFIDYYDAYWPAHPKVTPEQYLQTRVA